MKKILLLLCLLTLNQVFAQKIKRSVICPFGNSAKNKNLQLSQTVGQGSLHTVFSSDKIALRQGFQQPLTSFVGNIKELKCFLYPNPNQGNFNLLTNLNSGENYTLTFYDNNGKSFLELNGIANERQHIEFPESITPGVYTLQMNTENGKNTTNKIVITP